MNENGMKKSFETNWAAVDAQTDAEIDTSDSPPLGEGFFQRARWRVPEEGVPITLRVDRDVFAWYEAQGDARDERMAAALRIYAEAHQR